MQHDEMGPGGVSGIILVCSSTFKDNSFFISVHFRYNFHPNLTLLINQFEKRVGNLGFSRETIEQYINEADRYVAVPRIANSPLKEHNYDDELPYCRVIEAVDIARMHDLRDKLEEFKIGRTNVSEYRFPLQYCWDNLKQGLSMGMIWIIIENNNDIY